MHRHQMSLQKEIQMVEKQKMSLQKTKRSANLNKNKPAKSSDTASPDLIASMEAQMALLADQIALLKSGELRVASGEKHATHNTPLATDPKVSPPLATPVIEDVTAIGCTLNSPLITPSISVFREIKNGFARVMP